MDLLIAIINQWYFLYLFVKKTTLPTQISRDPCSLKVLTSFKYNVSLKFHIWETYIIIIMFVIAPRNMCFSEINASIILINNCTNFRTPTLIVCSTYIHFKWLPTFHYSYKILHVIARIIGFLLSKLKQLLRT